MPFSRIDALLVSMRDKMRVLNDVPYNSRAVSGPISPFYAIDISRTSSEPVGVYEITRFPSRSRGSRLGRASFPRLPDRVKCFSEDSSLFSAEMDGWRKAVAYPNLAGLLPPQGLIPIGNHRRHSLISPPPMALRLWPGRNLAYCDFPSLPGAAPCSLGSLPDDLRPAQIGLTGRLSAAHERGYHPGGLP